MKTKEEIKNYIIEKYNFKSEDANEFFAETFAEIIKECKDKISLYAIIQDSNIGLEDENNIEVLIFKKEDENITKKEFEDILNKCYLDNLEGINEYSIIDTIFEFIVTINAEY